MYAFSHAHTETLLQELIPGECLCTDRSYNWVNRVHEHFWLWHELFEGDTHIDHQQHTSHQPTSWRSWCHGDIHAESLAGCSFSSIWRRSTVQDERDRVLTIRSVVNHDSNATILYFCHSYRVTELNDFGEEEPPAYTSHLPKCKDITITGKRAQHEETLNSGVNQQNNCKMWNYTKWMPT